MRFADLPIDVRRAVAVRASLELLGFDLNKVLVTGVTVEGITPPVGQIFIGAALELVDGEPPYALVVGAVDVDWWAGPGQPAMQAAWNALSRDERNRERMTLVTVPDLHDLARNLIARGIMPPALVDKLGLPPGKN